MTIGRSAKERRFPPNQVDGETKLPKNKAENGPPLTATPPAGGTRKQTDQAAEMNTQKVEGLFGTPASRRLRDPTLSSPTQLFFFLLLIDLFLLYINVADFDFLLFFIIIITSLSCDWRVHM